MGLVGNMTVEENLVLKATEEPRFSYAHGALLKKKAIRKFALELQKKNDIRCASIEQEARNLSGGNQQKIILAREMENHPELLVAVHPTGSVQLVQHYPKTTPVIFWSLSILISLMTERQSVRFSSRVKVS